MAKKVVAVARIYEGNTGKISARTGTASAYEPITIARIETQDRIFLIDPPLVLRPRLDGDDLYIVDKRLSLSARAQTVTELEAVLRRLIPRVWDRYTDASLTRRDDGYRIGQALRRRIRVENRTV